MLIFMYFINIIFQVYTMLLFLRILSSWVPQANEYRITHFIAYYTDPYLNLFRRIIPPFGMIDLSPIVAFLALGFIKNTIINLIAFLS